MMMTKNQAMTAGAVAFATFALWYTFRRTPGGALADRPAQQQREAALGSFWGLTMSQARELTAALPQSQSQISTLTGKPLYSWQYLPGFTFNSGT